MREKYFYILFNYQCLDFFALVTPCEKNDVSVFVIRYAPNNAPLLKKIIEIYPLPGDEADLITWKEYNCASPENHADTCLIDVIGAALEKTDTWVI
jgi:hypothetical protein